MVGWNRHARNDDRALPHAGEDGNRVQVRQADTLQLQQGPALQSFPPRWVSGGGGGGGGGDVGSARGSLVLFVASRS